VYLVDLSRNPTGACREPDVYTADAASRDFRQVTATYGDLVRTEKRGYVLVKDFPCQVIVAHERLTGDLSSLGIRVSTIRHLEPEE
jgi:hypothetical protein